MNGITQQKEMDQNFSKESQICVQLNANVWKAYNRCHTQCFKAHNFSIHLRLNVLKTLDLKQMTI